MIITITGQVMKANISLQRVLLLMPHVEMRGISEQIQAELPSYHFYSLLQPFC